MPFDCSCRFPDGNRQIYSKARALLFHEYHKLSVIVQNEEFICPYFYSAGNSSLPDSVEPLWLVKKE